MNLRRLPISSNYSWNKRHVTKYLSYNYRRIIKFIENLAELRKFWKVNKINYSAQISKKISVAHQKMLKIGIAFH